MKNHYRSHLNRILLLAFGFSMMAVGIVLIVESQLGANSWNVFHIGLYNRTPLTLGAAIQVTSLSLVAFNWTFGEKPGVATFLELIVIGVLVDILQYYSIIPVAKFVWLKYVFVLSGVTLLGFGIALYIKADMGKGARDGVMFVLTRILPWPLAIVRTVIEVVVLLLGYLLSGPVGMGTVIVTFALGWIIQFSLRLITLVETYYGKFT